MWSILIIIGLIVTLRWLSKTFNRLGSFLCMLGYEMADYLAAAGKRRAQNDRHLREINNNTVEVIKRISGKNSEIEYQSWIKNEIDDLIRNSRKPPGQEK